MIVMGWFKVPFKRWVRKQERLTINSLRDEIKKSKKSVDKLKSSVLGVFPFFEEIEKSIPAGDYNSIQENIRFIGRWSPRMSRNERREIEAIQELEEDIKLTYPELYHEIFERQKAVLIFFKNTMIKNFSRYLGKFKAQVSKKNTNEIYLKFRDIITEVRGLIGALERLSDSLDIERFRREFYSEDFDKVHAKLATKYLEEKESDIKELFAEVTEGYFKNIRPHIGINSQFYADRLQINITISGTSSRLSQFLKVAIQPYARLAEKKEGFIISFEGTGFDLGKKYKYYLEDIYQIEKLLENAFEGGSTLSWRESSRAVA